jgi:transposase
MKEVNRYSDDFRKSVVEEVLSGKISKDEARRRYGIRGKSVVLNWIRKFDTSRTYPMKKKRPSQQRDTSELEAENKRLREELELERLRTLSLNVMIDLAEEHFKVPIRKKSGAKQSKK